MIIEAYRQLFLWLWGIFGFFGAIVGISIVVSVVCLPIYAVIGKMVAKENELQGVLLPQLAALKKTYANDAARCQAAVERLYARYQYNPFLAIRKVLPLFVALPFLFLTYYMLEGTQQLNGVSFLCFGDVGKADGLLGGVNLLPFVMTGINLLTAFSTPGMTTKDRNQAIFIALFFLVLLYSANAALMIYWCLNQFFNFLRSLYNDNWSGAKVLAGNLMAVVRWRPKIELPSTGRSVGWNVVLLFRNIVIVVVCVGIPAFFVIFGHMPDRLDIDVVADKPMTVRTGFLVKDASGAESIVGEIVQGCAAGKRADPLRFFLCDGCDTDALRIRFGGAPSEFHVPSVHLVRKLLFKYELPMVNEGSVLRCAESPKFVGFTFPVVKGSLLALKGGLVVLFLIAVCGLFIKKENKVPCEWRLSLALAALCAIFFAALLPCQTIFTNRDVFDYPLATIFAQDGAVFLSTFAAFFAVLSVASIAFGRWPHVIVLALFVYEYLQTGVLSLDAPVMDGNMNYYWTKKPMMVDFAVMGAIGLSSLIFFKWIGTNFRKLLWVCVLGLLALTVATVYDAASSHDKKKMAEMESKCPWSFQRSYVAKNLEYSPAGNVIVLVLDSTQSDASFHVAQVDSDLRAAFDGFTAFNNHMGMHDNTYSGSVGLFTGQYFMNDMPMNRHFEKCWGSDSFVTYYVQADNPVYVLPGILGAYSNRMENRKVAKNRLTSDSIFLRRGKSMNTSLLDVLQLRLVPFFLKKWDLQVMYLGTSVSDGTEEEHSLYPELANNEIGSETKPALIYIHTDGTHAPIRYDEFGNRLWADKDHYRGLCGETHYIMKSVAAFMRDLKHRGIYDNSLIIITADHGCCFDTPQLPKLRNLPTRAVPMLWIKPRGAHGDLTVTEIPSSHSKLTTVVKRAKDEKLTIQQMSDMLRTKIRRFRVDYEGFVDWYVNAEGQRVQE